MSLFSRIPRVMKALPCVSFVFLAFVASAGSPQTPSLTVDWSRLSPPTKTVITLQVVENPPLRRGSSIHDAAWANLAALHTEKTRLALWYPYPRMAVAELAAPGPTETYWDFKDMDPVVEDFFHATGGRSTVFTLSTIPTWMFVQADPGPVPASTDDAMWNYEQGTQLRDPTGTEVAQYFARVAGWYTRGGFMDEREQWHPSPHHYSLPYWEVLNEPEYEHELSIMKYTALYDKITAAVHALSPTTKFIGMSLAEPTREPQNFEYFLDPSHHAAGTPLDSISYHFYADAEPGETDETRQYTFFAHADAFLDAVRYIESIRKRLSPHTETHINEAGCISADDLSQGPAHMVHGPDAQYWSLCGAVFAYLYAHLAEQGIDVLGASQLLGYPGQYPSVSLLDWKTGAPNARYRALELLHRSFGPGDRIAQSKLQSADVYAGAYVSSSGRRKLLLINKRNRAVSIQCKECAGASGEFVDLTTAARPAVTKVPMSQNVLLGPFAVAILVLPQ